VRFLAPLIVNESEIDHSVQCLERACADLSSKVKQAAAQ
jgi:acetylornithine/succinyldiaminopimelate/putrescine aminotransferase